MSRWTSRPCSGPWSPYRRADLLHRRLDSVETATAVIAGRQGVIDALVSSGWSPPPTLQVASAQDTMILDLPLGASRMFETESTDRTGQ